MMTTAIEVKQPGAGTVDERFRGRVAVCARYPPKMRDGNRDSAVPDLLCDVSKQQVARLRHRATQMQQLGGVSIFLLFQVP